MNKDHAAGPGDRALGSVTTPLPNREPLASTHHRTAEMSLQSQTRRIAALGGGFSDDPDNAIDDYLLSLVPARRPRVCFVPTASGDSANYIEQFYAAFSSNRGEASHIELFRRNVDSVERSILSQDIVYVGGGNTANLLCLWRRHAVDAVLRDAYAKGIVLCGISAGAACWFEGCLTDSFGALSPCTMVLPFYPEVFARTTTARSADKRCFSGQSQSGRYRTAGDSTMGWRLSL
jgi:hypothetical protein